MRKSKIAFLLQNFYNDEMKISRLKLSFSFLSIVFLMNACSGNQKVNVNSPAANSERNANTKSQIVAQDDLEELGKIVKLPLAPEEATYTEINSNSKDSNSSADNKKLVAVLKFSTENANQIVANAEKNAAPAPFAVEAESWFPPELIAKSQETGDESLKGISYSAKDFLQSPYVNGRLTRINDTDYFVLELSSF